MKAEAFGSTELLASRAIAAILITVLGVLGGKSPEPRPHADTVASHDDERSLCHQIGQGEGLFLHHGIDELGDLTVCEGWFSIAELHECLELLVPAESAAISSDCRFKLSKLVVTTSP